MWIIFTLVVILLTTIYLYYKRNFAYWKNLGIPYLNPKIPFGDLHGVLESVPPLIRFATFYNEFKKQGVKHGGLFLLSIPIYFPIDPELIKTMFVKDFHHFVDRGLYYNERDQPIMANLFFMEGEKWKRLRAKLTPTFTSGKMRMMFSTMLECSYPLRDRIRQLSEQGKEIEAKEIFALFTTDVIGSCAFGIDCNSFKDPKSEFRINGKKIFDENLAKSLRGIFQFAFPRIAQKLSMLVIDKQVDEFFTNMVTDTYNYRKENNIKRNDFMQLLIDLKDSTSEEDSITTNELVAQAFIFFIAGFDTTATLLNFCLFELGYNEDIQDKTRKEINDVLSRHDGAVTYDSIKDMTYLDQIIKESLRKYPPVSILNRIVTEPYTIPGTNITLEKGLQVALSSLGLHRDPEYFPDPDKFDPERFSDENKSKIVGGSYLPFGDGPRICIGSRFALMEAKICLVTLLKHFQFSVNEKTKVPLEFGLGFITTVKGGVWLNSKCIE